MVLGGRSWSGGSEYRYGFNGKEQDSEVNGNGNQYEYGLRIYNPRLARFLSVDALTKSYPYYTPYQFAGNKPVVAIDLDGLEEFIVTYIYEDGELMIRKVEYINIKDRADDMPDGVLYKNQNDGEISSENYRGEGSTFDKGSVEEVAMGFRYQTAGAGVLPLLDIMKMSYSEDPDYKINDANFIEGGGYVRSAPARVKYELHIEFATNESDQYQSPCALAYADQAYNRLDVFLENNSDISVNIEGHTDDAPSPYTSESGTGNNALSLDRAIFVRNELISRYGVNPSQIGTVTGAGSSEPKVPNNPRGTPDGTPENRRVEVTYEEF